MNLIFHQLATLANDCVSRESIVSLTYFVGILAMYSLFINCLFGHHTFWRSFKFNPWYASKLSSCRNSNNMPILLRPKVNDDVVLHVLSYLNGYELSQTTVVSKRLHTLSDDSMIWSQLYHNTFDSSLARQLLRESGLIFTPVHNYDTPTHSPETTITKLVYYNCLFAYPFLLLAYYHKLNESEGYNKHIVLMIRNEVFDLTDFITKHPGGIHIIHEGLISTTVNKSGETFYGDATRLFEVANHSIAALKESRKFVLFSSIQYVGRKGVPHIVMASENT